MKGLGLGDKPYHQNIPESINDMLKDWSNFVPQEMDKFIVSVYDFVESFNQEEETAWFQLSEKWEVCPQFQHHLSSKSHGETTPEETKAFTQKVDKVCPDPAAYKRCHSFKFRAATYTTTSGDNASNQFSCDISELAPWPLDGQFSKEEQASLLEKAKSILHNAKFREGFQEGVFFVDSQGPLPYRVQYLKSGTCSCGCNFFNRNNMCFHCLAVAFHLGYSGIQRPTFEQNIHLNSPKERWSKGSIPEAPTRWCCDGVTLAVRRQSFWISFASGGFESNNPCYQKICQT